MVEIATGGVLEFSETSAILVFEPWHVISNNAAFWEV